MKPPAPDWVKVQCSECQKTFELQRPTTEVQGHCPHCSTFFRLAPSDLIVGAERMDVAALDYVANLFGHYLARHPHYATTADGMDSFAASFYDARLSIHVGLSARRAAAMRFAAERVNNTVASLRAFDCPIPVALASAMAELDKVLDIALVSEPIPPVRQVSLFSIACGLLAAEQFDLLLISMPHLEQIKRRHEGVISPRLFGF